MKINTKNIFSVVGAIATSAVGALVAVAQSSPLKLPPGITDANKLIGPSSSSLVCVLLGWAFTIAILLSVILTLGGAFRYMTSGGDSEKTKSAKNMLVYAAIGVAIAILARGFPDIVATLFPSSAVGGGTYSICSQ